MSTSLESFVNVLKRSGLIDEPVLAKSLTSRQEQGIGATGENFAEFLVGSDVITSWQAAKLLQGKHKGFFLGKYKLLRLLGKGGMSSVYLAEHVVMRRRSAIKVLPWKLVKDSSYLQRFHREAQAVAALDHPNIVRAYDIDHEKDGNLEIHFLVMEYVEGRNLFDLVQSVGPLSAETAAEYIRQGALGLAHAHKAGMVHRDVKPGNFIVDQHGTVKLMDLGLARIASTGNEDHSLTIAHDERVLGTADYLAPEQAVDSHLVDARADLYSLGCTMYFLLTGRPPFNEGTLTQRLLAHQTKEPTPIETLRPDVPASLLVILRKMMVKDREQRFQTADEISTTLRQWLNQQTGTVSLADPDEVHPAAIPPRLSEQERESPSSTEGQTKKIHRDVEGTLGDFLSSLSDIEPSSGKQSSSLIQSPSKSTPRVARENVPPASAKSETVPTPESAPQIPSFHEMRSPSASGKSAAKKSPSGKKISSPAPAPQPSSIKKKGGLPPIPPNVLEQINKWKIQLLAAGGLLIVLLGYLLFGGQGKKEPVVPPAPNAVGEVSPSIPATPQRPAVNGTAITVGPKGNFGTLSEAIQYLQDNAFSGGADTIREIQLAENVTLKESISIDKSGLGSFPRGVRIVGNPEGRARLQSPNQGPVVSLNAVDAITLENVIIDCQGTLHGMKLIGFMASVTLRQVQFENIQNIGINGIGFSGLTGQAVTIENCTFSGTATSAVGIQLEPGSGQDTRDLVIQKCRFLGPMGTGITVTGGADLIQFRQNIFHQTGSGIVFNGSDPLRRQLLFVNNTFHDCDRGISFESGQLSASGEFAFVQNLFVGGTGPAVAVQGIEASLEKLSEGAKPTRLNWTDRASINDRGELNIFSQEGRLGASINFASTIPADANFLKPEGTEMQAATASEPLKFVGAIAP